MGVRLSVHFRKFSCGNSYIPRKGVQTIESCSQLVVGPLAPARHLSLVAPGVQSASASIVGPFPSTSFDQCVTPVTECMSPFPLSPLMGFCLPNPPPLGLFSTPCHGPTYHALHAPAVAVSTQFDYMTLLSTVSPTHWHGWCRFTFPLPFPHQLCSILSSLLPWLSFSHTNTGLRHVIHPNKPSP
jgi:hypothetical protein